MLCDVSPIVLVRGAGLSYAYKLRVASKPQANPAQLLRHVPLSQEPPKTPAGKAAGKAAPVKQDDSSGEEEDSEEEESDEEEEVAAVPLLTPAEVFVLMALQG